MSNKRNYQQEYRRSLEDPEGFWAEQAAALPWYAVPREILSRNAVGTPWP